MYISQTYSTIFRPLVHKSISLLVLFTFPSIFHCYAAEQLGVLALSATRFDLSSHGVVVVVVGTLRYQNSPTPSGVYADPPTPLETSMTVPVSHTPSIPPPPQMTFLLSQVCMQSVNEKTGIKPFPRRAACWLFGNATGLLAKRLHRVCQRYISRDLRQGILVLLQCKK